MWVGNQSLKIFCGGGGQGRKDIVGILLLNELCWDEIADDITHDSPTAFSFFWSSRWLCSDCQCQQLTLCEYCEQYLHLSTILVDWMLSSWSEKGLSRKGICLKQTSSTSIRVELSFHSATSAGQMEELLHHLVFSKNIQPIVGGYFPYCRLSCRYLYCKLCAVGIDKISPFYSRFSST